MAASPPATESKWIPLPRDYALERDAITVKFGPTKLHPLLSKEVLTKVGDVKENGIIPNPLSPKSSEDKKQSTTLNANTVDDPLRMLGGSSPAPKKAVVLDPLRAASLDSKSVSTAKSIESLSVPYGDVKSVDDEFKFANKKDDSNASADYIPWRDKRPGVLTTYSTNKKIPVSANFLQDDEVEKKIVSVDSTKSRLEQLEMESGTEEAKNFLTQKEYIQHIEEQHEKMKNAWESGEKVIALKIAIQCAKLLGDTTVPHFYPSMYVLLTDILDTFGDLVFTRIKRKGVEVLDPRTKQKTQQALHANFSSIDVSASAKETCKNWFYKTACIRELLPRLYIDLALIKSYRFLQDPKGFVGVLRRLGRSFRGVGDPLSATYARAYLATKAGDLYHSFINDAAKAGEARSVPKDYQTVLIEVFDDFMFSFKQLRENKFEDVADIKANKIALDDYIDLFLPALDWLIQNIAYHSTEETFFALLQQYKDYCNNSAVLVHLLTWFDSSFIGAHALDMCTLIKEADEIKAVAKSRLYLTLGKALNKSPPPQAQRLPILNDVWKVVTKIQDAPEYIEIAEVFVEFLLKNFSDREVNIFLKDVIKHVKKDSAYKTLQPQLASIIGKIMQYNKELSRTLSMDNFLPILDLLDKEYKVGASKAVLIQFQKQAFKTADPVIIHTLFDVARSLHDSIDSLSFEDERKQVSLLIINFVRKIDFGRDLEQQLNMFVECRASFTNLDLVTAELVLRVALLAMQAHRFVKGNHSKKTGAFVKACLAYCHITIPSLDDSFARLHLLLTCGEVALTNQMVAQAEGFLKAAISIIPDVPPTIEIYKKIYSTEEQLVNFILNFCSFLLLFPGHPENGPFYLIKGLLNAIQAYPSWQDQASVGKVRVYLGVLSLFFAYYQRNFPYHVEHVESNDEMYGGESTYLKQILVYIDTLISEILKELTKFTSKGDLISRKQQGTLALEYCNLLVSGLTPNAATATLIVKLYQLAYDTNAVDKKYLQSTLAYIQEKKGARYAEIANKIISLTQTTQSTPHATQSNPLEPTTGPL